MIPKDTPAVDPRGGSAILQEVQNRRHGYLPQWNPPLKTAGSAIQQIFSHLQVAVLQRLNQVPAKNKLAFLDLLGLRLVPAQSSRAPIVFQLASGAADTFAPAGTQVASPAPPGSTQQVVFEAEEDAGVSAAKLTEIVSLWPGRDQYIDHSAAYRAGQPFTLFDPLQLQPTDHILYLAHSTMLAFAGTAHLLVTFDFAQASSSPLEIAWEYWDGKVWREFISYQPSCLDPAQAGHDGTNGLTAAGSVQLDTEGATTSPTAVNGVTSYWIRGRLTQPLLPDSDELLPEVETIRLAARLDQRLELNVSASFAPGAGIGQNQALIFDDSGQSISESDVIIRVSTSDDPTPILWETTPFVVGQTYRFDVSYFGISGTAYAKYNLTGATTNVTLVLKVGGLLPDKAVFGGKPLDATKAFFPLGQAPSSDSAFYFKQTEIFSKPGAVVQLYLAAVAPPSLTQVATPVVLAHTLNWEYWNGYEWKLLLQSTNSNSPSADFTVDEVLEFIVPNDMVSTQVNNEDGLWIRVRLVSGGYGTQQTVSLPAPAVPSTITFVAPQPPGVAVFRLGYSWIQGSAPLEQVLTYNNFQFEDHTEDALFPGGPFIAYAPVDEVTPALYLGFDKQLPISNFGIYADIVEQAAGTFAPAVLWEFWNGGGWQATAVEDETRNLLLSGMLSFLPSAQSQSLARFDQPLYWLRGRLKEDGPPNPATISNLYLNAVWASQWRTYVNEPLGASTGMPSQIFQFNEMPVLLGEVIAVQELGGPRANTEWRTLAMQVAAGDPNVVSELEALLASEVVQSDVLLGDIRLTRDKTKRVVAVWVRWYEQENFFESGPYDRHFVLDHATGRLFFGSGDNGMIPPSGAAIQAMNFRSGGGLAGNVAAATIAQLMGPVSGVQSVSNPRAAEGGADGETIERFSWRAPLSIRSRGRAVLPQDYETLAREASAGVAVARAIPTRDPSGLSRPGWVTLLIIPQSQDPRPIPSAGLRDDVRSYIERHAPADIAAGNGIQVIGPTYMPVDVTATLAPQDPAETGTVEQSALSALARFLHPLYGGPGGQGWDLGRGVYLSDVASVLGSVDGVDFVEELSLSVDGALQDDHVDVPSGQIVVAGQMKLTIIVPITAGK